MNTTLGPHGNVEAILERGGHHLAREKGEGQLHEAGRASLRVWVDPPTGSRAHFEKG